MTVLERVLRAYVGTQHGEITMVRTRVRTVPVNAFHWEHFTLWVRNDSVIIADLMHKVKYTLVCSNAAYLQHTEHFLLTLLRNWYEPSSTRLELADKLLNVAKLVGMRAHIGRSRILRVSSYFYATINGLKPVLVTSDGLCVQILIPSHNLRVSLYEPGACWAEQRVSLDTLNLIYAILDFLF